ncbi:hypothetical protein BDD12DRAFT_809894 [Trichophaea hybrida]|nr:hypothetical protein BDD12DRAFT_809894 [Trichophaea hybrida]
MNMIPSAYLPHHRYNIYHQLLWQTRMKLIIGHRPQTEFTPVIQPNHFLNHRILTFNSHVGNNVRGEDVPSIKKPKLSNHAEDRTGMLVPNPMVKVLRVSQRAYSSLPAAHPESQIEQDEYELIICLVEQSLNITIAAAKRLRINKLSGWQVAMREEKGLVATELKQPVSGKGYKGRKGFDGRYSQHVADVYQDPKRELHKES